MLLTSFLNFAFLTSLVSAQPATPKAQDYRLKVLSAAPGKNPSFDAQVQGYYGMIPSSPAAI